MTNRPTVTSIALAAALASGSARGQSLREQGAARLEQSLRTQLETAHARELPGHSITFAREDLGCALLVRAMVTPPLYPGTGVATGLVGTDGLAYGHRVGRDFANLGRACGWLRTSPSVATVNTFVGAALFDGMLATRVATTVALAGGTLRVVIRRAEPMSGTEVERIELTLGAQGDFTVARASIMAAATPEPNPRDVLRSAARGGNGDAMQLLAAVRAVRGTTDREVIAWLAAVSAMPTASDAIPSEAIQSIGSSAQAAGRLRTAWRGLGARRATLLELAGGLHGAAFRRAVER